MHRFLQSENWVKLKSNANLFNIKKKQKVKVRVEPTVEVDMKKKIDDVRI